MTIVVSMLFTLLQLNITSGQAAVLDRQPQASSGPSINGTDKQARLRHEEDEFMRRYVNSSPRERVEMWRHADSHLKYLRSTVNWRMQTEMEYVLIMAGVDSVPYLCDVLRTSDKTRQIRTLKLLSDIDRFVSDEEIILDAARGGLYSKALGRGGRVNPFVPVDGHRIGKEGFEAIQWAAQQKDNEPLKVLAKLFIGALRREIENLPYKDQVQLWREAVIKCKIVIKEAEYPEASVTYRLIETILMERMPDSIPVLVELLKQDKNPYVRGEVINIFARADLCSVRLRKIEAGHDAINDVLDSIKQGPVAPFYNQDAHDKTVKQLPGQFLQDQMEMSRASTWAVYAQALQAFYGDKIIPDYNEQWIREPSAELQHFVTYLTEKDPYYPRWEYINCTLASPLDEVVHARFRERIDRLHEEWRRFEAEEHKHAEPN